MKKEIVAQASTHSSEAAPDMLAEGRELTPIVPNTELKRYDGNRWRIFDLYGKATLILTSRGRELLSNNPDLRATLKRYRIDVEADRKKEYTTDHGDESIKRTWFRAGGNGDVYEVGNGSAILMKETSSGHSTWSALDRMDYLYGICLKDLPPHIRVPEMYGVLFGREMRRQFLLMEKIDEGVTVNDIALEEAKCVEPWLRKLVLEKYEGLEERVRGAVELARNRQPYLPSNLLPDWDKANVLVDFSRTTRDVPFTFFIIDQ